MSIEGKLVNELTTTTPAINDIALSTESASPTVLKRSTWQAIYNLFKGIYDSATATLTNKTISGASNTLTNIAQSSVTNLTTDLAGKAPINNPSLTGTLEVNGQNWTSAWTNYTPAVSFGSSTGISVIFARYKQIGKTCVGGFQINIATPDTSISGGSISLPVLGPYYTSSGALTIYEGLNTITCATQAVDGTNFIITKIGGNFSGGFLVIRGSFTYETN